MYLMILGRMKRKTCLPEPGLYLVDDITFEATKVLNC